MGKSNVRLKFQPWGQWVEGDDGCWGAGAQTRVDAAPVSAAALPPLATLTLYTRYVMPAYTPRLSTMDLMMYTPDKMSMEKSSLPISAPGPCFPGRYSPTYRSPDPMRRCMPNPSVSTTVITLSIEPHTPVSRFDNLLKILTAIKIKYAF